MTHRMAFFAVLGAFSIIGGAIYLAWLKSPRVGVDWAHQRFMLPPGTDPIIIPAPGDPADVWYETPQKRQIRE